MPDWAERGGRNIWLPYTQMKTAPEPLMVRETRGATLVLEDGLELIDGIASWWTACHGYNHPHIAAAVTAQLARMPHVMFGGLNHEPALTLAKRLCALLPEPAGSRFLFRFRLGRGRGRAENVGAVLAEPRRNRTVQIRQLPAWLSRRHDGDDGAVRSGRWNAQPV